MTRSRYSVWFLLWLLPAMTLFAERPTVSRQEAALLEEAAALAVTNATAALELIETARADGRGSGALDLSAGHLLMGQESYEAAEQAYRDALEKAPGFVDAQVGLGRALVMLSRWLEAESVLRGPAAAPEATEETLLLHGYLLLELNRLVSAESVYRRAALAGGESTDALFGLARVFLEQSRYGECAAVLTELLQRRPGSSDYWGLLADVRLAQERPGEARVALEAARRLDAATPRMLALLGDLYLHAGRSDEAVSAYTAARAASDDIDLVLRMVRGLLGAGQAEEAGAMLDQVTDVEPQFATRLAALRAEWAQAMGRDDEAMAAYRAWVELEPTDERALLGLGDLLRVDGDLSGAESWYERARLAHPQRTEPLLRLAQVALDRADYKAAAAHLERAHVLGGDPAVERSLLQVRRLIGANR